jgi:Bifunctional DNA primase/polymerase, N-terminal
MSHLGTEALLCAERGWHVFPVSPKDKAPLNEHGLNEATRDRTIIERWWRQWPYAMIGVRTGPESDFFAIDLDVDLEKKLNGITAFEALKNGGELPETIITQTPRGGRHLLFKYVPGVKNSAGKIAPGVDVRGSGGYVVVPPSRRADGAEYQFLIDNPDGPAAAPQWVA